MTGPKSTITSYDAQSLERLGTVLGVWAHPDDETYLCGALFAAAVGAGSVVACVTATRGEAGSMDHDRWPPSQLGQVRTKELDEALGILGVTEHYWLDYPDGACAGVPEEDAVRHIAEIIQAVQPDTVLTFGPDGMTGHADHIAVGRWATLATAETAATVHYASVTPPEWALMEETFFTHNISMGGRPDITDPADCSIRVELPEELLLLKDRAVRAQVSQTELLIKSIGLEAFNGFLATETFRLA